MLSIIGIPFRDNFLRCKFCEKNKDCCFDCDQSKSDFSSELDLYKEGYYHKDQNDQNKYIKKTIITRIHALNRTFGDINFNQSNKKIYLTNKNSEDEDSDSNPDSNKKIIGESNNRIMIAENSTKECLGFIYYNEIFNNTKSDKLTKQSIWIDLLATDPKHQKKGYMSILMNKLKEKNLPIALSSDHSQSIHSPGPKFYQKNNFTPMNIETFLKKANKINDTFYYLSNSQKEHLERRATNSQIYIWEPQ